MNNLLQVTSNGITFEWILMVCALPVIGWLIARIMKYGDTDKSKVIKMIEALEVKLDSANDAQDEKTHELRKDLEKIKDRINAVNIETLKEINQISLKLAEFKRNDH